MVETRRPTQKEQRHRFFCRVGRIGRKDGGGGKRECAYIQATDNF